MFFEILALKKVNEILLAKEGNIVSLYPFVKKDSGEEKTEICHKWIFFGLRFSVPLEVIKLSS